MLSIPDRSAHVTQLADWVELNTVRSPDGHIGFSTLVSSLDLSEEEQPDDIGEEDAADEAMLVSVQHEIASRREFIGPDYPFLLDASGEFIQFSDEVTVAGAIYLFCLFLTHANDRSIVPATLAPKIDNSTRDLFQACSTVAAAGYVDGIAFSFGWPRPQGTQFLDAIKRIYALFGDGTPVDKPPPAAPEDVKDDGIDIIAWRPSPDGLPGTHYLVGQVASGNNWPSKSVKPDSERFHRYWFQRQPATQHQDAIFMPFCLEPKRQDQGATAQEVLVDHIQRLTFTHGIIFYRYRIPRFAATGLSIHERGQFFIERVDDLPKVVEWVRAYSETLRTA